MAKYRLQAAVLWCRTARLVGFGGFLSSENWSTASLGPCCEVRLSLACMPDAGEPEAGYLTVGDPGNQAVLERLGAQQGSQPQAHSLDLPQHGRVGFVGHALQLPSMLVPQRAWAAAH